MITSYTVPGLMLVPCWASWPTGGVGRGSWAPPLYYYAVAGGSCIFARDFDLLPSLRFIQGIGGALGHTLGTVIMGTEFLFGGVNLVFVVGLMGLFMVPLSALCLG